MGRHTDRRAPALEAFEHSLGMLVHPLQRWPALCIRWRFQRCLFVTMKGFLICRVSDASHQISVWKRTLIFCPLSEFCIKLALWFIKPQIAVCTWFGVLLLRLVIVPWKFTENAMCVCCTRATAPGFLKLNSSHLKTHHLITADWNLNYQINFTKAHQRIVISLKNPRSPPF